MIRPILNIQFTARDLRALRNQIRREGGDAARLGIEITNQTTGEVTMIEQMLPLATIDLLLARVDAVDRAGRN